MRDPSSKRRRHSPPKNPDSGVANPETSLNSPEIGSDFDIAGMDGRFKPSPPAPAIAPNGVEWLPVPGWEKIPWLWHGFSTRRGGVTRAYSAEHAPGELGLPGELNLGFTAEDD